MHPRALDWERDGLDWPHRDRSRHVQAAGLNWHVQHWPGPVGAPTLVLIHGTGAATHSWRDLAPLLAEHAQVLTLDLPGHGFTETPARPQQAQRFSLPGMAAGVASLLETLQLRADWLIGHSAGAAIALQMCLDGHARPSGVIGLNAALLPMGGLASPLLAPLTRLLAATPLVPEWFARQAQAPRTLERLLDSTGSTLDATGTALYGRLVRNPVHAAGALNMMAHWDLGRLASRMSSLRTPVHLVVGENDRTVPPSQAERVCARLPAAVRRPVQRLPGLGHLAHEEDPERVAQRIQTRIESTP